MKLLILIFQFFSISVAAQSNYKAQVTNPEYFHENQIEFKNNDQSGMRTVKISEKHCKDLKEKREYMMTQRDTDQYPIILKEVLALSDLCYLSVEVNNDDEVVGFRFSNDSRNSINPMSSENGSSRQFKFIFEERSNQGVSLQITEDSGLTGRMSHDLLETTLIFIPRKVIPYIEANDEYSSCERKVVLPTEEIVTFNAQTNEIIKGVLDELPMDMETSRHKREFAGISYNGNGIMIRVDRRAGTPEHIYNQSFNVNEKIKQATITHKRKTCLVNKELIFENARNADIGAYFKYSNDEEFLSKVIRPICGWDITLEDLEAQKQD